MVSSPGSVSAPEPDLVVVSDLHLGEGQHGEVPRYSPTEEFFHDEAFARFLDHLHARYREDPSRLVLVLNGDTFDFLTVTRVPPDGEAAARGFRVSPAERSFGLHPSETKSVFKLDVIAAGHRGFFSALARFVALGHRVEILRGNHDLELYFPQVQERLFQHLASFPDGPDLSTVRARVRIHQWFYLEPGRVYIEHGNQYEELNSIRYPLRPLLPGRIPGDPGEELLDYPLGSLFVRFLYNRVRRLDPYAPRLISFDQYLDFLRRYNIFDVWRIVRDHYPHFVAALGPATTTGASRSTEEDDAREAAELERLAGTSDHAELFRKIHALKIHPRSTSKLSFVREMVEPVIRRMLGLVGIAFVALFAWLNVFQLIDQVPWVPANAFLMSIFAILTVVLVFWVWVHLDQKLRRRGTRVVESCLEPAESIARLTGVRLVLMGHTHVVDHRPLAGGKAAYANSGTWTSVASPWSRLLRDARRLTLAYVRGDRVELCRWNDDAGRLDPIPFFRLDEEQVVGRLVGEPAFLGPFGGQGAADRAPEEEGDDALVEARHPTGMVSRG